MLGAQAIILLLSITQWRHWQGVVDCGDVVRAIVDLSRLASHT